MRKSVVTASILGVILVVGIFAYWWTTIRDDEFSQTFESLANAGYTLDEMLQDPDLVRLASEKEGLPPNPDDWTQPDRYRAVERIYYSAYKSGKKRGASLAVKQVRDDAWNRLYTHLTKVKAVHTVLNVALKTRIKNSDPFTINDSLPASVRMEVEEAFGDDADAVLFQIEEAFATHDASMRVFESHGGIDGYVNHLIKSQSSFADE